MSKMWSATASSCRAAGPSGKSLGAVHFFVHGEQQYLKKVHLFFAGFMFVRAHIASRGVQYIKPILGAGRHCCIYQGPRAKGNPVGVAPTRSGIALSAADKAGLFIIV